MYREERFIKEIDTFRTGWRGQNPNPKRVKTKLFIIQQQIYEISEDKGNNKEVNIMNFINWTIGGRG